MAERVSAAAHLSQVLAIHFDPEGGAPYWLARQVELGFDVLHEIRQIDDLPRLGPMNAADLCERPLRDFVPRSRHNTLAGAIVTETGGTSGSPKRTVFLRSEFQAAFVTPFVIAAERAGFPRAAPWVWIGPSGPHVIAQAAGACATALGSPLPFSVDFDPRWYRRLVDGSVGRQRYLEHVLDQALLIINHEPIEVVFTTPPILAELAQRMAPAQRARVRGVHHGGMRITTEFLAAAQTEWFPHAVHLAGYGNSLFGVCMEFGGPPTRPLRYYPFGDRHQVRVADDGTVWMSRLDETILIANLRERDVARPIAAPHHVAGFGPGVEDPRPPAGWASAQPQGIY